MVIERAYSGYFDGSNVSSKETGERFTAFLVLALNSDQYVRLDGSARNGTIGKVDFSHDAYLMSREDFDAYKRGDKPFDGKNERIIKGIEIRKFDSSTNQHVLIRVDHSYEVYLEDIGRYRYSDFKLRMDDGKIIQPARFFSAYSKPNQEGYRTFVWLEGYTGPTVKAMDRKDETQRKQEIAKNQSKMRDALNQPVSVGDFIIASKGHEVFPAVIKKITSSGKSAYVVPCKENAEQVLVSYFYVINEHTKTAAMMRKLGAN